MFLEIVFQSICIFHCLFWIFVLFAFTNKRAAYINLFFIIPIVYIIHIFPFHFLESAKESIYPDDYKVRANKFMENTPFGILKLYIDTQHRLDDYCIGNPIGPQGMLIFGAITSAYALIRNKCI